MYMCTYITVCYKKKHKCECIRKIVEEKCEQNNAIRLSDIRREKFIDGVNGFTTPDAP